MALALGGTIESEHMNHRTSAPTEESRHPRHPANGWAMVSLTPDQAELFVQIRRADLRAREGRLGRAGDSVRLGGRAQGVVRRRWRRRGRAPRPGASAAVAGGHDDRVAEGRLVNARAARSWRREGSACRGTGDRRTAGARRSAADRAGPGGRGGLGQAALSRRRGAEAGGGAANRGARHRSARRNAVREIHAAVERLEAAATRSPAAPC